MKSFRGIKQHIALKLPKEIATTTILGGIINILINIFFMKKYGLIIASLSTLISYIYIALARYLKISKYVKIKLNYFNFFIITIMYIIIVAFYYSQSIIFSIVCEFMILIIFILMNHKFLIQYLKKYKILLFKGK